MGPAEARFHVHRGFLCKTSAFLKAACSKVWKEGQDKKIKLPECDSHAFNLYVRWLYVDRLEPKITTGKCEAGTSPSSPTLHLLVTLWSMGDFLGDITFTNIVIDAVLRHLDSNRSDTLNAKDLSKLLPNIPQDSKLRSLLMDVILSRITQTTFEAQKEAWPREVLAHLALTACRDGCNAHRCPAFYNRHFYYAKA